MAMHLTDLARTAMAEWRAQDLLRTPGIFSSAQHPVATIDGRDYVLFSSSNYLSLAAHPAVIAAATAATEEFGAGSGGSRLTTGSTTWHRRAEAEFAQFVGSEDAVLFATGYQANLSTIATIGALTEDLVIFSDSLNHASIIDGCRISRTPLKVFPHRDMAALEDLLAARTTDHALVITDGLFSMDGDIAPLPELLRLCQDHGAWLMVDDAHAVGTLGDHGRGTAEYFGCALPDILIGTASKALGAEGGFVCCSSEIAGLLRNRARSYVFSTAAPASSAAAISSALTLVAEALPALRRNVAHLCQLLNLPVSPSPIIPIPVGDEAEAMKHSAALKEQGLWVPAIRYPTVPRGAAILRVTVMAEHTPEHIEQLARALATSGQ
ncbi:aminotransferase class I/II-fold pyridoxal phosphate-dependent enzyme [Corynebacterium hindlerae]|uniref:aminotransferase class I/II-fold pyridoxal phosphate-dependent enzyme n=1 Tax=Corynebacterium hindlerae TaxID=699041 RepID=UPI003AB00CAA